MSKCSKLAQKKYKTRHDWVGKVIHGKLCKKEMWPYEQMAYAQTRIFLENEMHKILWDFEIKTNYLIQARRSDLVRINKKAKKKKKVENLLYWGLCRPTNGWVRIKEGKKEKST